MIRKGHINDALEIGNIKINTWRKTYFNIFPNRFMSTMLATLLLMVKKTRGTTIVYIKFKNTSPNGFKILAFSPRMIPKIQPRRIEQSKMIGKR